MDDPECPSASDNASDELVVADYLFKSSIRGNLICAFHLTYQREPTFYALRLDGMLMRDPCVPFSVHRLSLSFGNVLNTAKFWSPSLFYRYRISCPWSFYSALSVG